MVGVQRMGCFRRIVLLLVSVSTACQICHGFKLAPPEFSDPLKNISVFAGSNIELFCNVRFLGANRIMWMRLENNKQILLAINALVITNNPRITVSLLPSSGGVSQNILYIYAAEYEDSGTYHCVVNSSPVISQAGILEIKQLSPKEVSETSRLTSNQSSTAPVITLNVGPTLDRKTTRCDACNQTSVKPLQMFCVNIAYLWRQLRHYLLSWLSMLGTGLGILFE